MKKSRVLFLVLLMLVISSSGCFAENFSEGIWTRTPNYKYASSILNISHITNNSFQFVIKAYSGAHTGKISGTATIENNFAIFDDGKGGLLSFELKENKIIITQNYDISRYGGIGVGFAGYYAKGEISPKESSFVDYKILTPLQEEMFKEMTGEYYNKFKNTLHLEHEEDDLDGFGSKVFVSAVRGLFSFMECIIMVRDSDNAMWAAVIDGDKVRYFANTSQTQTLPLTIEKWRERFKNKPIIYQ